MEEEEMSTFDPKNSNEFPRDISEINLCIKYINSTLLIETGNQIPNWRSSIITKNPSIKTIEKLSTEIPIGNLFYPCSGEDIMFPIDYFQGYVDEFHFSDPFHIDYKKKSTKKTVNKYIEIKWIGRMVDCEESIIEKNISGNKIFMHRADGLLTLLKHLSSLSIFFYRGDSQGEGGSGQYWQGSVLLDIVLSRMMVGGLICMDESNGFGYLYKSLRTEEEIIYRNLLLKKLKKKLQGINGDINIWQVCKEI